MFLITGSGSITVLFKLEEMLPTLIGPWIVVLFEVKLTDELGWVHIEPWNVSLLPLMLIATPLAITGAMVSIELLPLDPCQFVKLQPDTAQRLMLFVLIENAPD